MKLQEKVSDVYSQMRNWRLWPRELTEVDQKIIKLAGRIGTQKLLFKIPEGNQMEVQYLSQLAKRLNHHFTDYKLNLAVVKVDTCGQSEEYVSGVWEPVGVEPDFRSLECCKMTEEVSRLDTEFSWGDLARAQLVITGFGEDCALDLFEYPNHGCGIASYLEVMEDELLSRVSCLEREGQDAAAAQLMAIFSEVSIDQSKDWSDATITRVKYEDPWHRSLEVTAHRLPHLPTAEEGRNGELLLIDGNYWRVERLKEVDDTRLQITVMQPFDDEYEISTASQIQYIKPLKLVAGPEDFREIFFDPEDGILAQLESWSERWSRSVQRAKDQLRTPTT